MSTISYFISSFIPLAFHTKKSEFHTIINIFIRITTNNFISTPVVSYLQHYVLHTFTIFSYLKYEFHTKWYRGFIECKFVFILPRTSAVLPLWTPTRTSSLHGNITPTLLYLYWLTTHIISHLFGCFLLIYCVAQCLFSSTEWLWLAPTAPKCQVSDALSAGI